MGGSPHEAAGGGASGVASSTGGVDGGGSGSVDPSAEWEELAAEWLDKAVSGAAGMYADAIFKISYLTEQV